VLYCVLIDGVCCILCYGGGVCWVFVCFALAVWFAGLKLDVCRCLCFFDGTSCCDWLFVLCCAWWDCWCGGLVLCDGDVYYILVL